MHTKKSFCYKHSLLHGFTPSQLVFSQAVLRQMIFELYFCSLTCNRCMANYDELKKSPKSPIWTLIFAKCIWSLWTEFGRFTHFCCGWSCISLECAEGWNDNL